MCGAPLLRVPAVAAHKRCVCVLGLCGTERAAPPSALAPAPRAARTQQPVATVPVTMAYAIQAGINAAVSGMNARAAAARPRTIAVDSAA